MHGMEKLIKMLLNGGRNKEGKVGLLSGLFKSYSVKQLVDRFEGEAVKREGIKRELEFLIPVNIESLTCYDMALVKARAARRYKIRLAMSKLEAERKVRLESDEDVVSSVTRELVFRKGAESFMKDEVGLPSGESALFEDNFTVRVLRDQARGMSGPYSLSSRVYGAYQYSTALEGLSMLLRNIPVLPGYSGVGTLSGLFDHMMEKFEFGLQSHKDMMYELFRGDLVYIENRDRWAKQHEYVKQRVAEVQAAVQEEQAVAGLNEEIYERNFGLYMELQEVSLEEAYATHPFLLPAMRQGFFVGEYLNALYYLLDETEGEMSRIGEISAYYDRYSNMVYSPHVSYEMYDREGYEEYERGSVDQLITREGYQGLIYSSVELSDWYVEYEDRSEFLGSVVHEDLERLGTYNTPWWRRWLWWDWDYKKVVKAYNIDLDRNFDIIDHGLIPIVFLVMVVPALVDLYGVAFNLWITYSVTPSRLLGSFHHGIDYVMEELVNRVDYSLFVFNSLYLGLIMFVIYIIFVYRVQLGGRYVLMYSFVNFLKLSYNIVFTFSMYYIVSFMCSRHVRVSGLWKHYMEKVLGSLKHRRVGRFWLRSRQRGFGLEDNELREVMYMQEPFTTYNRGRLSPSRERGFASYDEVEAGAYHHRRRGRAFIRRRRRVKKPSKVFSHKVSERMVRFINFSIKAVEARCRSGGGFGPKGLGWYGFVELHSSRSNYVSVRQYMLQRVGELQDTKVWRYIYYPLLYQYNVDVDELRLFSPVFSSYYNKFLKMFKDRCIALRLLCYGKRSRERSRLKVPYFPWNGRLRSVWRKNVDGIRFDGLRHAFYNYVPRYNYQHPAYEWGLSRRIKEHLHILSKRSMFYDWFCSIDLHTRWRESRDVRRWHNGFFWREPHGSVLYLPHYRRDLVQRGLRDYFEFVTIYWMWYRGTKSGEREKIGFFKPFGGVPTDTPSEGLYDYNDLQQREVVSGSVEEELRSLVRGFGGSNKFLAIRLKFVRARLLVEDTLHRHSVPYPLFWKSDVLSNTLRVVRHKSYYWLVPRSVLQFINVIADSPRTSPFIFKQSRRLSGRTVVSGRAVSFRDEHSLLSSIYRKDRSVFEMRPVMAPSLLRYTRRRFKFMSEWLYFRFRHFMPKYYRFQRTENRLKVYAREIVHRLRWKPGNSTREVYYGKSRYRVKKKQVDHRSRALVGHSHIMRRSRRSHIMGERMWWRSRDSMGWLKAEEKLNEVYRLVPTEFNGSITEYLIPSGLCIDGPLDEEDILLDSAVVYYELERYLTLTLGFPVELVFLCFLDGIDFGCFAIMCI